MERADFPANEDELEPELQQVAEMITPLPKNIVPSQEFIDRTRAQLLGLDAPAPSERATDESRGRNAA